jgi:ribosomal-protein-alanine N-acetyltransferase
MTLRLPIHTPRLSLRDFVATDVEAVFAYTSDPMVAEHMFYAPWTHEHAEAYIENLLASQRAVPRRLWELAIIERASGALVGSVDLTPEGENEADVGYVLARSAWGHGYATEAAAALLEAGFARLRLRRVVAMCAVENVASRQVLEKIGLRHVDTVQGYRHAKGRDFDVHRFEVRRDDWRAFTR